MASIGDRVRKRPVHHFIAEQALLVSDMVYSEVGSTKLQASLLDRQIICVNFSKIAVFPKLGVEMVADDLVKMIQFFQTRRKDVFMQSTLVSEYLETYSKHKSTDIQSVVV